MKYSHVHRMCVNGCVHRGRNLEHAFNDVDDGLVTPRKGAAKVKAEQKKFKQGDRPKRKGVLKPRKLAPSLSLADGEGAGFFGVRGFPEEPHSAFDQCLDFVHLFKAKHTIEVFLLATGDQTELPPSTANPKPLRGIYVRALIRALPNKLTDVCLVDWLDRWTGELWAPKNGEEFPAPGQVELGREMFAWRVREQFSNYKMNEHLDMRIEETAIKTMLTPFGCDKKKNAEDLYQSARHPHEVFRFWEAQPRNIKALNMRYIGALKAVPERIPNSIGVLPFHNALVSVCGKCQRVMRHSTDDGSCPNCGVPNINSESYLDIVEAQHVSKSITDKLVKAWKTEAKGSIMPKNLHLVYHPKEVLELHIPHEGARFVVVVDVYDSWLKVFGLLGKVGRMESFKCTEDMPVKWDAPRKWLQALHKWSMTRRCGCSFKEKNPESKRCAFGRFSACCPIMMCGCVCDGELAKIVNSHGTILPPTMCGGCSATSTGACTCPYTIHIHNGPHRMEMEVNGTTLIRDVFKAVVNKYGVKDPHKYCLACVGKHIPSEAGTLGACHPDTTQFDFVVTEDHKKKVLAEGLHLNAVKIHPPTNKKNKRKAAGGQIDDKHVDKKAKSDFVPETPPSSPEKDVDMATPPLAQSPTPCFDLRVEYEGLVLTERIKVGSTLVEATAKVASLFKLTKKCKLYHEGGIGGDVSELFWNEFYKNGHMTGKNGPLNLQLA